VVSSAVLGPRLRPQYHGRASGGPSRIISARTGSVLARFAVALVLSVFGPAPGEPQAVQVILPSTCEGSVRVDESVRRTLSETPSMRARIELRPVASGAIHVFVDVTTEHRGEQRTLEAPSCASAIEAASLVLAIAVHALSQEDTTTPDVPQDDAPAADLGAVPAPPPVEASNPVSKREDGSRVVVPPVPAAVAHEDDPGEGQRDLAERPKVHPRVRGGLHVDGGVVLGIVPNPAAIMRWGGSVWLGRIAVRLAAVRVFPREASLAPQGTVRVGAWGGTVSGTFEWRWRKLAVPLQVGVLLAALEGEGSGVPGARTQVGFYGAAQLGTGVRYTPHRLVALGPEVALLLAFARPRFGVESAAGEPREAFAPSVAGMSAVFAVELRFP